MVYISIERLKLVTCLIISVTSISFSHGIIIGNGVSFELSNCTISLDGDWVNNGSFNPGGGTVVFNGNGDQTISTANEESFYNIIVDKPTGDIILTNDITVNGICTILNGDLDLNGNVLNLGSSATLSESPGNTVKGASGTLTTIRTLDQPNSNYIAGMGLGIFSSANLGLTTITRGHTAQIGNSNTSILRYFDISPATKTELEVTLVFHYDDSELNSLIEAELTLFNSVDNGVSWEFMGGSINTSDNTVTLATFAPLYRWTLASRESPVPVELVSFSASTKGTRILLEWQTATEVNNFGFDIERKFSNSVSEFKKIGFVEGHGNSNSPKVYTYEDEVRTVGEVQYRLKQIDTDGTFEYFEIAEASVEMPKEFKLAQNYPNPFNPLTSILFDIPEAGKVVLKIFNSLGQQVAVLLDDYQEAGRFEYNFDASNLSSGVYIYSLSHSKFNDAKKMIVLK